jgi:hypothetical protein
MASYRERQTTGTILTFRNPVHFRLVSAANNYCGQFANIFKMVYLRTFLASQLPVSVIAENKTCLHLFCLFRYVLNLFGRNKHEIS